MCEIVARNSRAPKATRVSGAFALPYANGRPALHRDDFSRRMTSDSSFARASSLPRRLGIVERRRGARGIDHRLGNFPLARRHRRQASRSASTARDLGNGRNFRVLRRADSRRGRGRVSRTGGVYVFIRESWGRLPAFLFGWSELVIIRAAALGAISTTFSEYFLRVLGHDPRVAPYSQLRPLHRRRRDSSHRDLQLRRHQVGLAGSESHHPGEDRRARLSSSCSRWSSGSPQTGGHYTPAVPAGSFTFARFGLALVSVLWVYDGWADVSFVGGEVKDPERNLPRVLILGTLDHHRALPTGERRLPGRFAGRARSANPSSSPPTSPTELMGAAGVAFVSIAVMISTFGTLNGSVMTGSRILFAMAADGLLFKPIAIVTSDSRLPASRSGSSATLGVVFVLLGTFEQLADTFVTAIVPFYALAVAVDVRLPTPARLPVRHSGFRVIPLFRRFL